MMEFPVNPCSHAISNNYALYSELCVANDLKVNKTTEMGVKNNVCALPACHFLMRNPVVKMGLSLTHMYIKTFTGFDIQRDV